MKPKLLILILVTISLGASFLFVRNNLATEPQSVKVADVSHVFTLDELSKYNGDDPSLPIYIGMNGFVYDVTAGKKFYEPGGSYHDLAGRDSSVDLNIAGGGIIKSKYPVVGRLSQ